MRKNSEISFTALWNKAIPLRKARFQFAPHELMQRLEQAPSVSYIDMLASVAMQNSGRVNSEVLSAMRDASAQFTEASQKRREILHEINMNFLNMLRRQELRCFAFEHPRSFHAEPVELTAAHWVVWPDWEKGEFRHAGLHLIEIRVIEAEQRRLAVTPEIPAPSGRPSFKAEVLEAFTALQAEGRFKAKPLTHGIAQIRAWIKANRPESRAAQGLLGDDTIRNAIKPLLAKSEVEKL